MSESHPVCLFSCNKNRRQGHLMIQNWNYPISSLKCRSHCWCNTFSVLTKLKKILNSNCITHQSLYCCGFWLVHPAVEFWTLLTLKLQPVFEWRPRQRRAQKDPKAWLSVVTKGGALFGNWKTKKTETNSDKSGHLEHRRDVTSWFETKGDRGCFSNCLLPLTYEWRM